MNYGQLIFNDTANGPGFRVSLFVSGCTNKCPGCFNQDTWNFHYGDPFDNDVEIKIIEELRKPQYDGLTILGGEPFEPENQGVVNSLIQKVRKLLPDKSIWVYTGDLYENLIDPSYKKFTNVTYKILRDIDVLVDGPFILEQKNVLLRFKGSENQRLIDMKKTIKNNNDVVLYVD